MLLSTEKSGWREAIQLTLPKEHGSWSLALEPIALGLLVAPSRAGVALAVAAMSGFFLRRPLKLALTGQRDARQPLAILCVFLLALMGLSHLLLAAKFGIAGGLWPLLPAALTGLLFAWCDAQNEAREGAAELAGAITFGILPAAFGALAGWNWSAAVALAAIMLVRCVPTVLLVRTCLRRKKGRAFSLAPALVTAGCGIVAMFGLTSNHLAPWTAAMFAVIFFARSVWFLVGRPNFSAKTVGIFESILGVVMVLVMAFTWKNLLN